MSACPSCGRPTTDQAGAPGWCYSCQPISDRTASTGLLSYRNARRMAEASAAERGLYFAAVRGPDGIIRPVLTDPPGDRGIGLCDPRADPRDHLPCGCGHLAHDHHGERCDGTSSTMADETAAEAGLDPDLPCLCTAYGAP